MLTMIMYQLLTTIRMNRVTAWRRDQESERERSRERVQGRERETKRERERETEKKNHSHVLMSGKGMTGYMDCVVSPTHHFLSSLPPPPPQPHCLP